MFIRRGDLVLRFAKRVWDGMDRWRKYYPQMILYLLQLDAVAAGA